MDKLVPGYLKPPYATNNSSNNNEDKDHEITNYNYFKIHQISEQLSMWAKSASHTPHVGLDDLDRVLQVGELLKKELDHIRNEFSRRKNLELLLPTPNTQHHLPCSSLLSVASTSSSPTPQQMSMNSASAGNGVVPQSPTGSTSPHSMVDSSMSVPSTGVMQSDDYWRSRKMDPTKIVRRSPTPLYVNLTEQMILAQSSKRKRPAEGDLYCHNCKTKDTPEWRRGPMGAKTLCNACGIRWRLSQAEAAKQKKGELSPTQTSSLSYSQLSAQGMNIPSPSNSPSSSPTQSPTQVPTHLQVQQSLLQHQQQQLRHQQLQHQLQQQQMHQQMQHQYNQSHAHHHAPHPQQQHMVVSGLVGLAQENGRLSMSDSGNRGSGTVLTSLSLAPSPIAT